MNILLINLPREGETEDFTTPEYLLTDFMSYPPLGLLAIAADVDPRHSIEVLDTVVRNMSLEDTIQYVIQHKPDILGISAVTRRLYGLHTVSREIKGALPKTRIVAGGPHINYFPLETIQLGSIDYALPGFGETTFPQLAEAIEKGENPEHLGAIPNLYYRSAEGEIRCNPLSERPALLDSLPFPNRRLVNLENYYTVADRVRMTTLYTSRGCPFHCIFCDVQEKTYHFRSATKIVDEFEEIMKLGIKELHIFDDTFNLRRQRVLDMCREILARGLKVRWTARARVYPFDAEMAKLMKESGCARLHVGVESLDPDILKAMRKGVTLEQIQNFFRLCKEFGLDTLAYFIIGFPGETREYRRRLPQEIKRLGPTYLYFNVLYPLPKTEYYRSLLENGTYERDFWADFVRRPVKDYEIPAPRSKELQTELEQTVAAYHRKFFYDPKFILRELRRSIRNPRMLWLKLKVAVQLFVKTRHRPQNSDSALPGFTQKVR